ncbi:MAG: spondin domain-containing protein [Acidobacteria bacterium]|nr:spondin domain-containing protein [Candidatus Sulfomarinibacter kjeldsenii]
MKRTILLGVLAVMVVVLSAPAMAQDMIKVRITNVSKQIISPPVIASHSAKIRVFVPGSPASTELSMLAEDGNPLALATLLDGSDEVLDVKVADGPLLPGATMVFELESRGRFNRVSAVGMLVTTNDGFFGLDNFLVDRSSRNERVSVPAWDAGTEFNNELCGFIPGPPCGSPLVRDTDGAEGFIHTHPGLHGGGDLSPSDWSWQNPVVDIRIMKK